MKQVYSVFSAASARMAAVLICIIGFQTVLPANLSAQIWEPEGVNMPGGWNGWTNPPVNNLALASSTQVPGGRIVKYPAGIARWQTIFSVAASGGDLVGGTYPWLFTSGATGNPWGNKWCGTTVQMNTLQNYAYQSGPDNSVTLLNGKWYTVNFEDAGYNANRAIFMETSAEPVSITAMSLPATVYAFDPAVITLTLSALPSAQEVFYVRYSIDGWSTSSLAPVTMAGTTGTAIIPGQPAGTSVNYYSFSSTVAGLTADYDLYTIRINSGNGTNYTYTVTNPPAVISFASLDGPAIDTVETGSSLFLAGKVTVPGVTGNPTPATGMQAWLGYSTTDTDPSGWTSWVPATFTGPVAGSDHYHADLGLAITTPGLYWFAVRFKYNTDPYVYGGYSASGGGFWNGTTNISGQLLVAVPAVPLTRTLDNVIVASEQTACYDAKLTITATGFIVQTGGTATLVAGQNILLEPGVIVQTGGNLHGYITTTGQYCWTGDALTGNGPSPANAPGQSGEGIRIYPNPAQDLISVSAPGTGSASRIEVTDLHGRKVFSGSSGTSVVHSVDVSSLPAGVYIVRLILGNEVRTGKLIRE